MKQINKMLNTALLCLSLLILPILLPTSIKAQSASEELERLLNEQELLEQQWQEAQYNLEIFQSQRDLEQTDLAWLLQRSAEEQAIYEEHTKKLAAITDLKKSLDRNLEIAIMQYETRKENYAKRIEGMYNQQNKSQLEILLESDSLPAYFTTLRLMKLISDADEQELKSMREARDRLEKQREEALVQLEQYNELVASIQDDMAAIEADIFYHESSVANLDDNLQQLYGSVNQYANDHFQMQLNIDEAARQKEYEDYLAEIAAQQAAAAAAAEEAAQYSEVQYSGSGFIWPIAGHDGITSEYGWRYVAELNLSDFHNGIDFAANYGHPVMASASGSVVFAGWYNQYGGNTVRIDVGGGIVIMYCHLSEIYVGHGQYVNAGETIAAVGSTGLSSGPHLHFQIDVGGQHVDPRLYLY